MAIIDNFSEEELRKIVQESHSYAEVIRKLGYTSVNGRNNDTLKLRLNKYNISVDHFTTKKGTIRTIDNVFCKDSTATQTTLRKWYLKGEYVPYKCDICGLKEWQGKPISLQLDHKNGDNHDNRLENLHWLCPNCHSQTKTYSGKNSQKAHATKNGVIIKEHKINHCIDCGIEIGEYATRCTECAAKAKRIVERPDKNSLEQILFQYKGNFTEVAKLFGVTDNSIRKWCKKYELPYHSKDYKS